jgi:hypothetical protein
VKKRRKGARRFAGYQESIGSSSSQLMFTSHMAQGCSMRLQARAEVPIVNKIPPATRTFSTSVTSMRSWEMDFGSSYISQKVVSGSKQKHPEEHQKKGEETMRKGKLTAGGKDREVSSISTLSSGGLDRTTDMDRWARAVIKSHFDQAKIKEGKGKLACLEDH